MPVSLSSDPGCLDPPITIYTVCPSPSIFSFLSIYPLHSYSSSCFILFLLCFTCMSTHASHILTLPFSFCSFILYLSGSPPNCLAHFLSLPLSFSPYSYLPVVVWVVEPHLHPIRFGDRAFCASPGWE